MQVLLAYALDRPAEPTDVEVRLQRVEGHYGPLWQVPVDRHGRDAGRLGLHLWDAVDSPWRWPSWQADERLAVATLYLPLGYERLVGTLDPGTAAMPLARALLERPRSILEMTGPLVIASMDSELGELRLHTDGLGIGRLFELRFDEGWVYSNRPLAVCRFAGVLNEADRDGWRMLAASEWFLGDRTPFARVFAVPGGSTIVHGAHRPARVHERVDALAAWADQDQQDALSPDRIEAVAAALTGLIDSLDRMSDAPIVADLSGGRDSRVVAAAALAAGLDVTLETGGAEPGEADVAERLVAALPAASARRVTHHVSRPAVTGAARTFGLPLEAPIVPNVIAWHRVQEGLRSPTYVPSAAPPGLTPGGRIRIGGAAGEIAHGHYYPADYASLNELPFGERLDALLEPLAERVLGAWGVSAVARATAQARIRQTLEAALLAGLDDARTLDYFYAAERLRRWGTTGEGGGRISPLLVPEFIRAAFSLSPDQRRQNALHVSLTGHLVPEWRDKPYYVRPPGAVAPAFSPRLAAATDRDRISAIVSSPEVWADGYDPALVARSWRSLSGGGGRPADERLLQRVLWRAGFDDFLAEVNGDQGPRARDRPPSRVPSPGAVVRGRRFMARGLRKAARFVEPRS